MRLRHLTLVAALASVFPLFSAPAVAADAPAAPAAKPWMNKSLSFDQRAQLAVKAMTREEKLRWVFGYFGTSFAPKGTKPPEAAIPFSAGTQIS